MSITRILVRAATALALVTVAGVGSAASTHAAVARADEPACGYDGYINGRPMYNHCGKGSVVIEVDHFFWQTTYVCVPPGVHELPMGDSQWRIYRAEFDGHTCIYRFVTSIVGP